MAGVSTMTGWYLNSKESTLSPLKAKPSQKMVWQATITGSSFVSPAEAAISAEGSIYLVGVTGGNLEGQLSNIPIGTYGENGFVSKINSFGSIEWTRLIVGGSSTQATSATIVSDGSVLVSGYVYGGLYDQVSKGGRDAFISKYSADGNREWTKLIGGRFDDYGYSVDCDSKGSIYIAGSAYSSNYSPEGLDGESSLGGQDAFVAKYNLDGTRQWMRLLSTSGKEEAKAVGCTA
jgi:hypothetical protein